jgi:hypothetical protein
MRKLTLLGVVAGLIVLAIPAAASANAVSNGTDCTWTAAESVAGTPAYVGHGSTGNANTTAAGVCVTVNGKGGYGEAGTDGNGHAYVVLDGNKGANGNPAPGDGYMGLSNYDDAGSNGYSCSQNAGNGASTNGGGCFGSKTTGDTVNFNALGLGAVPTPMCGDTSGADWNQTPRDGCFV